MTLTELRYLVTLARIGHFGRAAEACHVSQPTLSIAIRKLEEELGIAVFERHRHELIITPAGERIIEQARRVLDESEQLRAMALSAQDEFAEPLRVGAIFTIGPYLFPTLIRRLREQGSGLTLYIEENYTHVLIERLKEGELDVIIIADPLDAPETRTKTLYREPFRLLLRKDHPLGQSRVINSGGLSGGDMLLLGEGHCFRDQMLETCPHLNPQESHIPPGGSLETIRHMVALGLGMTMIPETAVESLTRLDEELTALPLSPAPTREVVVASRYRFSRPRALAALMEALQGLKLPGTEPL